jgi:uncharacterized glyoxalase superfamily protein PhnB
MSDTVPGLTPAVVYRDPKAAMAWLEGAFGFELTFLIEDGQGGPAHIQMSHGASHIMISHEWSENHASPASVGGKNTQAIHIYIDGGVDAHCERARAAGAQILEEPANQFYGDRTYRCRDLEGHIWTVASKVETVSVEEMEARSGLRIAVGKA